MSYQENNFEKFNLNKQLYQALQDLGFEQATEIQDKAIPLTIAGHDLLGIAQTGTGKTAAYLLPLLMKVKYAQGQNPRAIILAPTRELVIQIHEHLRNLGKYLDLRYAAIYGGTGANVQKENLAKGVDILVATPGRLMELYHSFDLVLKDIKTLVLDEADKMMDMGFMPQIRKILEVIPRKRQNLLYSATMHTKVIALSEEFLEYPVKVEITPQATPAKTVQQCLYHVPNFKTKINLLQQLLLKTLINEKVIIFTKTKTHADNIFKFIERKISPQVRVIHGNKGQNSRINAINEFKDDAVQILVATDVAARGLDISMVNAVVNFDVPVIYEDYVHRIGRTGRAGKEGKSYTFATPLEQWHIEKIEKLIRLKIPVENISEEVVIEPTDFEESQLMAREMDALRKKADPNFKGAFHDKKVLNINTKKQPKKSQKSNKEKHNPKIGKTVARKSKSKGR